MKGRVTAAERKRQDMMRQKALKTGRTYESRLFKLRRKEIRRVLDLCSGYDPYKWADIARVNLEEPYLFDTLKGLVMATGMPVAEAVAQDLSRQKDDPLRGVWEQSLADYADLHLGENIVSMEQTLATAFSSRMADIVEQNTGIGIEKLTRMVFEDFCGETLLWQCRRIARTETMISLGRSGDIAARSLGIAFTKKWSISGVGNTRESHIEMDGTIVAEDEPFIVNGYEMMYPTDSSGGAPAGEIVNCACTCIRRPI